MSEIRITVMSDLGYESEVLAMMESLYTEDEAASEVDRKRFPLTIRTLVAEPARGQIYLFIEENAVRGYALGVPFWSNEFGGVLLMVDELYVKPDSRSRGIGRRFFEFISENPPFGAVAAMLEVSPANVRARRLYESIGFRRRRNVSFTCRLQRSQSIPIAGGRSQSYGA